MLPALASVSRAGQDASLWPAAVERLRVAAGADTALLAAAPDGVPLCAVAGLDADAWRAWLAASTGSPAASAGRDIALGNVAGRRGDLRDGIEHLKRAFPFLGNRPVRHALGMEVALLHGYSAYLLLVRDGEAAPFSYDVDAVLFAARPHLQVALSQHLQTARLQSGLKVTEVALDAFDQAVIRLDAKARVTFCSRVAQRLLAACDDLALISGVLSARDTGKQALLQFAVSKALAGGPPALACGSLPVQQKTGETLHLTMLPEPVAENTRRGVLIFLSAPSQESGSRAHLLRQLYGVSPTESRVADLLAEGLTIREAATQLKLHVETVRFYVKRLLAKTGTRRQVELIRLMLRLPNL